MNYAPEELFSMHLLARMTRLASLGLLLNTVFCASVFAQAKATADSTPASKVEIYGGYAFWRPVSSGIAGYAYPSVGNKNATVSVTDYFFKNLGLQVEGSYMSSGATHTTPLSNICTGSNCDQLLYSGQVGPVYRFPHGPFVPYVHALGGAVRMNGPAFQHLAWGYDITAGGGMDLVLPYFHKRFALRPLQLDYQYDHVDYGATGAYSAPAPPNTVGGIGKVNAIKISAGLVVRFGMTESVSPLVLGCTAQPVSVYPGDIVTVTSDTIGIPRKRQPSYTWAARAGNLVPSGPTATVDTTGLAPGQYDVVGHVSIGPRPTDQAYCSAPFNVKTFDPPTISCEATPATAVPGTNVTINCTGTSPQRRPLTYSYSTTGGQVNGTGPNVTLSTAGLGSSTIAFTGTATDDLGQTATTTVQVTLTKPAPPVVPVATAKDLCSLSFTRDLRRPGRVNNEAKGCLDDIADTMNRQSDAKLVIVGNSTPKESPQVAAERALNARLYLSKEKGIDASRIEVRVGDTSGKTARTVLVPAGATFTEGTTQLFDESGVPTHGQAYPGAKSAKGTHHHKAHKKLAHKK